MPEDDHNSRNWNTLPWHRQWLVKQAEGLFDFFQHRALNPAGGFFDLDAKGAPLQANDPVRGIHASARMVHCFSIGHLLGRPGCGDIVDHGMTYLWNNHRDGEHGGYFWQVNDAGPVDATKQGYGHAFVLLAASSAKTVGHPLADPMLADITEVLETRFWEEKHGAIAEEFNRDWSPIDNYRGQNSNMHLTEALMAAYEATGDSNYLTKAERIADLVIRRRAGELDFRVPEHFDENWTLDKAYRGNEMFRPSGSTPATGWNGRVSSCNYGCSVSASTTGCRWPPNRYSYNPWRSAGIGKRAASFIRSTGTTTPTSGQSSGGPCARRRVRPTSSTRTCRPMPSTRIATAASGAPSPTTSSITRMAAGTRN